MKRRRGVRRGHWLVTGQELGTGAGMSWPGANNVAGGGISAANDPLHTFTGWCPSAGHFRVISLIQPRHTINNYLRTTGEQARQDTGLPLVRCPELLDSDWSCHRASWKSLIKITTWQQTFIFWKIKSKLITLYSGLDERYVLNIWSKSLFKSLCDPLSSCWSQNYVLCIYSNMNWKLRTGVS